MNMMKRWTYIGPEWKTDDIFRIREILKEKHIPFKMPFSDVFFMNFFNPPTKEKRWGILVREKDLAKTAALLIREGLAWKELWVNFPEDTIEYALPFFFSSTFIRASIFSNVASLASFIS